MIDEIPLPEKSGVFHRNDGISWRWYHQNRADQPKGVLMTTILIVDDVPDNIELAKKILTSKGYEVLYAQNAEAGLNLAINNRLDLILLDLGLPDYDGLTLAGQFKAKPSLEKVPIIAFTAWPPDTAKTMAESYGCIGFISKPILRVNEFLAQVEQYLPKG